MLWGSTSEFLRTMNMETVLQHYHVRSRIQLQLLRHALACMVENKNTVNIRDKQTVSDLAGLSLTLCALQIYLLT